MKNTRVNSLSTGDAARLLSVTPDTVLKWVKLGKVPAIRTAGGHYRIESKVVEDLLCAGCQAGRAASDAKPPLRCWEYFSADGRLREACSSCAAYLVRAGLCYELVRRDPVLASGRLHCSSSCEDCPYYQQVQGMPLRVLLISKDRELAALARDSAEDVVRVRIAGDSYAASAEVGAFRPSIVALDAVLPEAVFRELLGALSHDSRIPWARLVIVEASGPSVAAEPRDENFPRLSRSALIPELRLMAQAKLVEPAPAS